MAALGIAMINLAHFAIHFAMLIFPTAVIGLHAEWGMTYGDALEVATPAYVAFALGTLPAGWLGDRWGADRMMWVFLFGLGVALVGTGLADGPLAFAIGLAAVGLASSIYHPVATTLIVRFADRPGRALGFNGVFGNMGVAAAPLATAALLTVWGWHAAFLVPGVLVLLAALAALLMGRGRVFGEATGRGKAPPPIVATSRSDVVRVIAVVGISALLGGLVFSGVTIALPKLFDERLGGLVSGLIGVGAVSSAVFALAAFTQIPAGRLIDAYGAKPVLIAATGLQVVLLSVAATTSGIVNVIASLLLVIVVFGEIPITAWLLGRTVAPQWRSRVYAVEYLLSLGVSSAIVPLIGNLHNRSGDMQGVFLLMAAAAAGVFLAAWALPAVVGTVLPRRLARSATTAEAPASSAP